MPNARFDLVSHWHIESPVEQVWAALTDPASWPRWWPYVHQVTTLRQGDAEGVGAVRRIDWSTRLPYRVVIDVEVVEAVRLQRLRGRSRHNKVVNFAGLATPGETVPVEITGATSQTLTGEMSLVARALV